MGSLGPDGRLKSYPLGKLEREKALVERSAGRSIDQQQQRAAERWRKSRRTQELERSCAPSPALERKSPEKDRGLELDGPEIE